MSRELKSSLQRASEKRKQVLPSLPMESKVKAYGRNIEGRLLSAFVVDKISPRISAKHD
jgi:hypothetical protein